jgi:hypothetical protein
MFFLIINMVGGYNILHASPSSESFNAQDDPISSRLNLTITQQNNDVVIVDALVRAKIDDRFTGLKGLSVKFYALDEDGEVDLGNAVTNSDGIARITVERDKIWIDTAYYFTIGAMFEGNDEFSDSDDELELKRAEMIIMGDEETDDENNISRKVSIRFSSNGEPVEEADAMVYVNAMLRPLMVGEMTTDENGEADVEFPTDLRGDADGNVSFYAFVEDYDDFGNVKATIVKPWGSPVVEIESKIANSLTSPDPPLWLLLTFLGLLVVIWGHYIEVIFQLFKLKKMARSGA